MPEEDSIVALRGRRFPGGEYTVQHWENFLLTECTGAEPLPGGMVHPAALFHLPIAGAGTSIAEMFDLGQAESDVSILIESYDWELHTPLIEDVPYRVTGEIIEAERLSDDRGRFYDRIQFLFNVSDRGGTPVARTRITWRYTRNTL